MQNVPLKAHAAHHVQMKTETDRAKSSAGQECIVSESIAMMHAHNTTMTGHARDVSMDMNSLRTTHARPAQEQAMAQTAHTASPSTIA